MTRILNTGIFVDPIGTAKKTPEEEIQEIQEVFQEMKDASDLPNYVVWWGEAEEQKIKRWEGH